MLIMRHRTRAASAFGALLMANGGGRGERSNPRATRIVRRRYRAGLLKD